MARILGVEAFCALEVKILKAELALKAMKRKRAGFMNGYGWRYCACGETNMIMESPSECPGCANLAAELMVAAHDSGEHVMAPLPGCLSCYGAFKKEEKANV